jgi:hypothetical protein
MVHMGSHVLFVFAFQKCFLKKLKLFLFFYLLQINIFLVFLDHFDALISKIIFKNKKILFDIFLSKKYFKK